MGFESVELGGPETAVTIQKGVEHGETVTLERVDAALAFWRDRHEPRIGERLEVP